MTQVFPIEVYNFVKEVAARNGLELTFLQSNEPPTIFIIQPVDVNSMEGPSGHLVRKFVETLNTERMAYDLPIPIHIETLNNKSSSLPFGITDNLPNIIHLVRISTLE